MVKVHVKALLRGIKANVVKNKVIKKAIVKIF